MIEKLKGEVASDKSIVIPVSNWEALFWGAATSAIFAFVVSRHVVSVVVGKATYEGLYKQLA